MLLVRCVDANVICVYHSKRTFILCVPWGISDVREKARERNGRREPTVTERRQLPCLPSFKFASYYGTYSNVLMNGVIQSLGDS